MVLVMPASPEETVMLTPAATAESLKRVSALRMLKSG